VTVYRDAGCCWVAVIDRGTRSLQTGPGDAAWSWKWRVEGWWYSSDCGSGMIEKIRVSRDSRLELTQLRWLRWVGKDAASCASFTSGLAKVWAIGQ
jgi:hypothetical protein